MSIGKDFVEENEGLLELYMMEVEEKAKRGVWETRDGEKIHISDMSTTHILNALAFLKRRDMCDVYEPWIHRFENELTRRMEGTKDGNGNP